MASKTKASAAVVSPDVEFEPYCEWQKEEGRETLVVHLPEFKKEQLRVQVNNQGLLKVSGARPLDGTRKSRFLKESMIPDGCDVNDIRAKFTNGRLHVTMPKKVQIPQPQQELKPSTLPDAPKSELEDTKQPKTDPTVSDDQKPKTQRTGNGMKADTSNNDRTKDGMFGSGSSLGKLQVKKNMTVSLGVAAAVIVAIGAYAAYRCVTDGSCSSSHTESYGQH